MKDGNENKYAKKFMKFSYEDCLESASKYDTVSEFKRNEPDKYRYSKNKKWLKDFPTKTAKFSYEDCKNKSLNYKTLNEFKKEEPERYRYSNNKGWIKDFTWLDRCCWMKYTYDDCYNAAKEYKTLKDFSTGNQKMYHYALRQKWVDNYTWLERVYVIKKKDRKTSHVFTYDECYEIAKKYDNIKEFIKGNKEEYTSSRNHGWLSDYYWLTDNRNGKTDYITYDYCYELANECFSRTEMRSKNNVAFSIAKNNGWLKDYTWFHSIERATNKVFSIYVYEEPSTKAAYVGLTNDLRRRHRQHLNYIPHTQKYDTVKTYFDSVGAKLDQPKILKSGLTGEEAQYYEGKYREEYHSNGWTILNKAATGAGSSSVGIYITKWTYEVCYEIAKKYKTRMEFFAGDNLAYQASCRNGWIDKFGIFPPLDEKYKKRRKRGEMARHGKISLYDSNGIYISTFDSCKDLADKLGVTRSSIYYALRDEKNTIKGYFVKKDSNV